MKTDTVFNFGVKERYYLYTKKNIENIKMDTYVIVNNCTHGVAGQVVIFSIARMY